MTLICLLLGWLALAGYLNAIMIFFNEEVPIPTWFGLFALAYGVTASGATYRLWQMNRTGVTWFRSWATVVILMSFAMIPIFSDLALGGIGGMLGFVAFAAALLWLLDRYVSAKVAAGR